MNPEKSPVSPQVREYLSRLGRIRSPKKLTATRENMRKARAKRWPPRGVPSTGSLQKEETVATKFLRAKIFYRDQEEKIEATRVVEEDFRLIAFNGDEKVASFKLGDVESWRLVSE